MAVLVQAMVDPVAAGVAFTAHPVTGDRDQTVVTAVAGLGDPLVSGEAVGEEWTVTAARGHADQADPGRRAGADRRAGAGGGRPRPPGSPTATAGRRTSSGPSTTPARCGCCRPGR